MQRANVLAVQHFAKVSLFLTNQKITRNKLMMLDKSFI
jgi:hypothetical protein